MEENFPEARWLRDERQIKHKGEKYVMEAEDLKVGVEKNLRNQAKRQGMGPGNQGTEETGD